MFKQERGTRYYTFGLMEVLHFDDIGGLKHTPDPIYLGMSPSQDHYHMLHLFLRHSFLTYFTHITHLCGYWFHLLNSIQKILPCSLNPIFYILHALVKSALILYKIFSKLESTTYAQ